MSYDRNLKFGGDQSFSEGARRVADLLWDNSGRDVTSFPRSYLENLRHDFSDGKVSMLELIDRVDLGPDATYEDYCEVVDALMRVDPRQWPDADSVQEVSGKNLLFEIEPDYDFSEFDFADEIVKEEAIAEAPGEEVVEEGTEEIQTPDPLSQKMETFLKKVISSAYLDGVSDVTDMEGNPPNSTNNYLMSEDGKSFSGIFYDASGQKPKRFPFKITEKNDGNWGITY
jgi:hypothetical protein